MVLFSTLPLTKDVTLHIETVHLKKPHISPNVMMVTPGTKSTSTRSTGTVLSRDSTS